MLNVQDKKNVREPEPKLSIANDIGHLFARYGATLTLGRVFGLLLASDEPLSLDEIAAQLGVSKSGASVAARDLERVGVVHRMGTQGSRRVLYEATEQMETTFAATFARVRDSLTVMKRTQLSLPPGKARRRMNEMVEVHEFWLKESDGIMERWSRRRNGR